ncbi:MAG: aldehyde dehydrogenase (NADP(+)) [Siphonobacter sp.]
MQLIGYQESNAGTETFFGYNPAVAEKLEPAFVDATEQEINQAVALANQAFDTYRLILGKDKAAFLEAIVEEILAIGDELLQTAHLETALPIARLTGERGRTTGQLKLFAELLREGSWVEARMDTALPDRQPLPRPDLRQMLLPIGPVAVFGASNFPFAFSVGGGDTVSALAAGCPVIFKAHPAHPATCQLVGKAILKAARRCEMPEGVFSMVHGTQTAVGMSLVRHPFVKAVAFTGSFRGGKALYDAAQKREEPIPVYAEMGSTNPVFFLPGILKERGEDLAQAYVSSLTQGVGQFCTNPGVAILPAGQQAFASEASRVLSATKGGYLLTAGIKKTYEHGIEKLSAKTKVLGIGLTDSALQARPIVVESTVKEAIQDQTLTEEVFGPSSVLLHADNDEDIYNFARQLNGHLTATIHGTEEDFKQYAALISILQTKVGRLIINGFPTGVEVSHAMTHGGPFPATTDARSTSVGTKAIVRFTRPVSFQDFPDFLLPDELKTSNPLSIWRMVNGNWEKEN